MIQEYEQLLRSDKAPKSLFKYDDLNSFHDTANQSLSKVRFPNGSTGWDYFNYYRIHLSAHDARLKTTFGPIADITIGGGFLGRTEPDNSQKFTCFVRHADQFEGSVKLLICTLLYHIAKENHPDQSLEINADKTSYPHVSDQKFIDTLKEIAPDCAVTVKEGTEKMAVSSNDSASLYDEAINSSDIETLRNAGTACAEGSENIRQDFDKAYTLLKKAADQGDSRSQNSIGDFYFSGVLGSTDYNQAKNYYELAAAGGSVDAMRSLGAMYLKGLGVSKDPQKACDLFQKAVDNGCTSAGKDLAKAKRMLETATGTNH